MRNAPDFSTKFINVLCRRSLSMSRTLYFVFVVVHIKNAVSRRYIVLKGNKSNIAFELDIKISSPN